MTYHVHFFGCSLTAGDELSDSDWFQWKSDITSAEKYYMLRDRFFENNYEEYLRYMSDNKTLAYPAQIQTDKIKTYNHARNGHSLRTNIFNVLMLLGSNEPVDMIVFQIPPSGRELFINGLGEVISIQSSVLNENSSWIDYLRARAISHDPRQYAVDDAMDMIMLFGMMKEKNIPFLFVELSGEMDFRLRDIESLSKYRPLLQTLNSLPITKIGHLLSDHVLLGRHYSAKGHEIIASYLTDEILQKLDIK